MTSRVFWGHVVCAFLRAGWKPPTPSDRVFDRVVTDIGRFRAPPGRLTHRERRVIELMAAGFEDREIAVEMVCAYETLRKHNKMMFAKLGARNRTQAVAIALRSQVLEEAA